MIDFIKSIEDYLVSITEAYDAQEEPNNTIVVAKNTFSLDTPSNESMLYVFGILTSRLAGAKALKDDILIEECQIRLDDAKTRLDFFAKRKEAWLEICEYQQLLLEAKSLLTKEEERTIFLEEHTDAIPQRPEEAH